MRITVLVENDMIRLPAGVHLPDGTPVELNFDAGGETANQWPADYFERTSGALAGEPMERPAQGDTTSREVW